MRDLLRRQWRELRLNVRPREFLYWFVQNLLLVVIKIRMRVQVFGGEHYAPSAPATLIISSHKRDWDPLICATYLYYQRGWWRPDGRRMAFVGREDMLSPGFMAEIVGLWHWPRWVSWLMDHINLAPIIGPLRAYPIARVLEYSMRQYLFELRREQGNLPLTAVFSDEYLEQLDHWAKLLARRSRRFHPRPSRELRVSDILTWDYREPLMERLRRRWLLPERYAAYKTRQREKINRQVRGLVGALEQGDTLWLAPEGMITQDGAPRRVRESLYDLLAILPAGVRVLPANVTYDFMTTDRLRACISIGPPLEGLAQLERADLSKTVIAAMTGQAVVTMSMLGSRFLWERLQQDQPVFTFEAAWAVLAQNVQWLATQGVTLEQGLRDARRMRRRLRAFLAYGLRHGLLSRQPDGAYHVHPAPFQQQRESFFWLNPRYSVNELLALEAALAQREGGIIASR
jgi:1-acyl-sn-glycerol-3-phosphate acyltransferase